MNKVWDLEMDITISLRFDPYKCFTTSTTPVGLYARQKWMGGDEDEAWQADFDECTTLLMQGQLRNGSWASSFVGTARRLFGLHLTIRYPINGIEKALDWLFDQLSYKGNIPGRSSLRGLPFVARRPQVLFPAMALFLNAVFGRADSPDVVARYKELSRRVLQDPDGWGDHGNTGNILRALVVHPVYAKDPATAHAVESLSMIQDHDGTWPEAVPFYQTVNALAHLDHPLAERQLEKAFTLLERTQNEDGTWGTNEKEWNTFLVVHAMRNKKILA